MTGRMDLAEWVIGHVAGRGEVEVTITGGTHALTRFANSFIHQNVGEEGDSLSIRLAVGGRVVSATTTSLDPEALAVFVDAAIARTALQPVDPDWPGLAEPVALEPAGHDAARVDHYDEATGAATPADRAALVADFVAAGEGMSAAGFCETGGIEITFANSNGVRLQDRFTRALLDGIHQTATSAGSGHAASGRIADLDGAAIGAIAARRAVDSAATVDVAPGGYEVVLSPECVATIGIFLAYYGFNAKAHQEGQSFVELGVAQFDGKIELVDDVTDPRAMAAGFDTEGTLRTPLTLIAGGVTSALAHDRRTARRAGLASTGHAVPGSEVHGPFPSSMFLAPGDHTVDELIADVERGLYVATFNYCRVLDPKSMVVTGLTRNGTFLIENGQITGAVSGLRFTQSFVEALGPGQVLGVGNDARFADSEFGAGFLHVPSMRLASWNITGGAAG